MASIDQIMRAAFGVPQRPVTVNRKTDAHRKSADVIELTRMPGMITRPTTKYISAKEWLARKAKATHDGK